LTLKETRLVHLLADLINFMYYRVEHFTNFLMAIVDTSIIMQKIIYSLEDLVRTGCAGSDF